MCVVYTTIGNAFANMANADEMKLVVSIERHAAALICGVKQSSVSRSSQRSAQGCGKGSLFGYPVFFFQACRPA